MQYLRSKATRQGRMFVHTLAKFDDARRGSACGCQIVDLLACSKVLVTYFVVSDIDFKSTFNVCILDADQNISL